MERYTATKKKMIWRKRSLDPHEYSKAMIMRLNSDLYILVRLSPNAMILVVYALITQLASSHLVPCFVPSSSFFLTNRPLVFILSSMHVNFLYPG